MVDSPLSTNTRRRHLYIRGMPGVRGATLIMAGPMHMLSDSLEGQTLVVAREGSGWITWKIDERTPIDRELDAKLVLNLGKIVGRAFDRVAERGNQSEQVA